MTFKLSWTKAPTTVPSTPVDTSVCYNVQKFYDASNKYIKTACLVGSAVDFTSAQSSCTSHGMKLYVYDTTGSITSQQLYSYASSLAGVLFGSPYRLWINSGPCNAFVNNITPYGIGSQPCTDTMYYICEFV